MEKQHVERLNTVCLEKHAPLLLSSARNLRIIMSEHLQHPIVLYTLHKAGRLDLPLPETTCFWQHKHASLTEDVDSSGKA